PGTSRLPGKHRDLDALDGLDPIRPLPAHDDRVPAGVGASLINPRERRTARDVPELQAGCLQDARRRRVELRDEFGGHVVFEHGRLGEAGEGRETPTPRAEYQGGGYDSSGGD